MPKALSSLTDAELAKRIKTAREEVRTWWELRADASAFGKRDDINRTAKAHRNAQEKLRRLNKEQTRRYRERRMKNV